MEIKSNKSIKTSYMDRLIWIIFALVVVMITAYIAYPRSFDSLVKTENHELYAMVNSLDGRGHSDNNTYELSPIVCERVFKLMHEYKYRKEWSSTAKSYSEGKLVFLTLGTGQNYTVIQLISNGDMLFSNKKSNENYKVVGGSKLFDEVYALIEADSYNRSGTDYTTD